ncbi:hypothetical protein LXL04_002889 [Taraxacum kok-saghyz]
MSLFVIPVVVAKELEALRARFFWGGTESTRKIAWVKWANVLASMEKGGLNLGSLVSFNLALVMKWRWRFVHGDQLWVSIIRSIYGVQGGCSPWARVVGAVSKLYSKGVVDHNALRRKLGDGKQIHFWSDCWLGRLPLKIEYPRLAALEEDVDCRVADRWSRGGWRWHWRQHITGGVTAAQLEELNHRLLEVNCVDERDTWVWDLADDGLFSVAVTRNWIDDKVLPVGGHNTRWFKIVPRKHLPTRELLTLRGIFIHTVACPMCGLEDETLMHVFGRCEVVEVLWRRVFSWMGISPMLVGNPHSMFEWVDNSSVNGNKKKVMETIVYAVYWYVWRYRNDVVHESEQIRKSELFDFIREVSYVWFFNRQKKVGANWINWLEDPLNTWSRSGIKDQKLKQEKVGPLGLGGGSGEKEF